MDDSIKPMTNQGFFSYVFKLSKFKQEDLLNILQYSALSIAPIMVYIYFTKKYFPTIVHTDSSLYIFIVTFFELMFMILGIFFIDRIVNFIPTFSGKYYEVINLTGVLIVFVTLLLLSHAGFRERTAILLYRFDKWFTVDDPQDAIMKAKSKANGKTGTAANKQSSNQTTLNPQISQQYAAPPPLPVQGPSMSN